MMSSSFSIQRFCICAGVAAASFFGLGSTAEAVILYRTPTRNTGTPGGVNANSGWQWQGNWANGFLGTPIHKNYFITAAHVGGGVGQNLYVNGKNYKAIAAYDDPATDLRIYKIEGAFSSWAPLYTGSSETGKRGVVFGRGTTRGAEVKKGTTLKGWKWGTQDKVKSWGENYVAGYQDFGAGNGQFLKFQFNKNGLTNEAALSNGDSGGGIFVNDAGKWKLAGINYFVDGAFSLTGASGSGFQASIFDKGGLYVGSDGAYRYNADTASDIPGQWYSTRISARQGWIKSVIGTISTSSTQSSASPIATAVPEPAGLGVIALGATALLRRRRRSR